MKCGEAIGFSHAEVYCVKCGRKESYNGNKPLEAPIKCQYCGERMTDTQREKFMVDWKKTLDPILKEIQKEIQKNKRTKEDQFTIDLLESIKNNFINDNQYYGSEIKLIINGYIKRMK